MFEVDVSPGFSAEVVEHTAPITKKSGSPSKKDDIRDASDTEVPNLVLNVFWDVRPLTESFKVPNVDVSEASNGTHDPFSK